MLRCGPWHYLSVALSIPLCHLAQQTEPGSQCAAVTAATVALGKARISAALAPLLPKIPPAAKVNVLRVLSASEEKLAIAAVSDAEDMVRLAALERRGEISSAASIPVLFKAATAGSVVAQTTATAALASMPDLGAGSAITKLAGVGSYAIHLGTTQGLLQCYSGVLSARPHRLRQKVPQADACRDRGSGSNAVAYSAIPHINRAPSRRNAGQRQDAPTNSTTPSSALRPGAVCAPKTVGEPPNAGQSFQPDRLWRFTKWAAFGRLGDCILGPSHSMRSPSPTRKATHPSRMISVR